MPLLTCEYCGNQYKLRNNFNKHIILCEIIYKANRSVTSKTTIETEEVNAELPSPKQMYQMLLELAIKYNTLETKIELMGKWVDKTKKKINILDWLNNNSNLKPSNIFENLANSINILESDINLLFNNTFYDLLNEIFLRHIYDKNESDISLFALIQKPNTIYVYSNSKSDIELEWIEVSREKLIYFLNIVHFKIVKSLLEWLKRNQDKVNSSDQLLDTYNKSHLKLMSIDFKHEPTLNKIKSSIYNKLKKDMKALIEYEFEF
jgi:hypothetical protein